MKNKGLSLIEVIVAIILISLIMVSFGQFASVTFSSLGKTSTYTYDKMAVQKLLTDESAKLKNDYSYLVTGDSDYNITTSENMITGNEFNLTSPLTYTADDNTTHQIDINSLSFNYKILKVEAQNPNRSRANLFYAVGDYDIKVSPLPKLKKVWIDTFNNFSVITRWKWTQFQDPITSLPMYIDPKVEINELITESSNHKLYGRAEVYSDPDLTDEFYTDNLLIKKFEWFKTKNITYNVPKDNFSSTENKNYTALWPNFENDFEKLSGEDSDQLSSKVGLSNHFVTVRVTPISKYYTLGESIYSMPLYIEPDFMDEAAFYLNASRINVKSGTNEVEGEVDGRIVKNWIDLSSNHVPGTIEGALKLKQPFETLNPYMHSRYVDFSMGDKAEYALTANNTEKYQIFYVARGEENVDKVLEYKVKNYNSTLPIEDQLIDDMHVINGYVYAKLNKDKVPEYVTSQRPKKIWSYEILGKKYYLIQTYNRPYNRIRVGERYKISHIEGTTLIGAFRYNPLRRLKIEVVESSAGEYYAKFKSEISELYDGVISETADFERRRLYWDDGINNWYVKKRRNGVKFINSDLEGIKNLDGLLNTRMFFKAGSRYYSIDRNGGIIYKKDGNYYFTYSFGFAPEKPKVKSVILSGSKVNMQQYVSTSLENEKPWIVGHADIYPESKVTFGNSDVDIAEVMVFKGDMSTDKQRQIIHVLKQKYLPVYDTALVESVDDFEETYIQGGAYSMPVSAPAIYQGQLVGLAAVEFSSELNTSNPGTYTLVGNLKNDKTKTFTYTLNVLAP